MGAMCRISSNSATASRMGFMAVNALFDSIHTCSSNTAKGSRLEEVKQAIKLRGTTGWEPDAAG
eukprot:12398474-Karenia_brevis.AAC.1